MCNLYSLNKGRDALKRFFRITQDDTGNMLPLPGILPDSMAPVIRTDGPAGNSPPLRVVGAIGLAVALAGAPLDVAAQGNIERGRAMAERLCARCHAISGPGPSPMAGAPAFSTFERTWPVEHLAEALAEGITTGHGPIQIPAFDFTTEEIDDLLAFLESVQE
jgi:mono/diheme cytochrome c family protein